MSKRTTKKQERRRRIARERDRRWQQWLAGPAKPLTECGFPDVVFQSEDHWDDFLVNIQFDYHDGFPLLFRIADLRREDAERALECLAKVYRHEDIREFGLVTALRERLGLPPFPDNDSITSDKTPQP